MANESIHFNILSDEIKQLGATYLPKIKNALPTPSEQELARAFAIFCHAEMEFYIESICREVGEKICLAAAAGTVASSAIPFIVFSNLQALGSGEKLGGKDSASRKVSTQFYQAKQKYEETLENNIGIREKHIAKLLIPLGLTSDHIDPNFLVDIDQFASHRGRFAHLSRSKKEAGPLTVNPWDFESSVERILNGPSGLPKSGKINSLRELDAWQRTTINNISTNIQLTNTARLKFKLSRLISKLKAFTLLK